MLVSTHYMDEAERCHDIAYIAYGELIARGTAEDILASTHLVTWEGEGPGIDRLSARDRRPARRRDGGAVRRDAACERDG